MAREAERIGAGENDETQGAPAAPARADAPAPPAGALHDLLASFPRDLADESGTYTDAPWAAITPRSGDRPRLLLASQTAATGEARASFAPGTTLVHYEIIRPLGHGGMGDVYLARDTRLGRRVALKFLLGMGAQKSGRFLVEARATAQLAHENIVALYDIVEHEAAPFMVLEYVPGKTLAAFLKARAEADPSGRSLGLPPGRAAELMLPVARALQCAHEAGIIHRDLKPANIMLAESGTVKVLDFGIAKLLGEAHAAEDEPGKSASAPEATREESHEASALDAFALATDQAAMAALTKTGTLLGTRAYMAPEQWWSEPVDGRTDLWAVGIMLYQLVTGEHPLSPLSAEALVSVGLRELPMPSVRERLPEIGKLGALIDRCLLKHKDDRLGSARELCEALEAIARPHASGLRGQNEEQNPYAGLSAFQEQDAARFFGREALGEQVILRLIDQPLLALVGASGAGKSSLVRAGVIPALRRGGDAWEAFITRPGPHPLTALADLLLHHGWQRSSQSADAAPTGEDNAPSGPSERAAVIERLRAEPGFLGFEMRARARRRLERLLLFVDQFEEVYTLASEEERTAFLACLAGAADDPSSPLRVVLSIRHDFLDRLAASDSALAALVSRGTVLVGPLDRRGLVSALVAPAEALAYRFESDAVITEMVSALEGAAGALPLLQFTAAKLWEGRDRERRLLTEASYRAFGGVGGALASHADSVLGALSSIERRCARALLVRLVTPERTRAIVTRRELCELGGAAGSELDRVLSRLIEARLLTVESAGKEESTVELVHESLIESWPVLGRWLDEEQEDAQLRARLRGAALEWEASGKAEGLLWRGEAAEEARRFQKRMGQDDVARLSAREARYLEAVVALDARERQRRRRLVGAVIAALCAVVLMISGLLVRANRAATRAAEEKAEAQSQRAEAQARRAEAEQSAATARNASRMAALREQMQSDPTTALALVREIEPGPLPPGWAALAMWAPNAGVAEAVMIHGADVNAAAWSLDGKRIVTGAEDGTLRVWGLDRKGPLLAVRADAAPILAVGFSPDGARIVSASDDKTVRVGRADGSGEALVLRGHEDKISSVMWSPDGAHIVSASYDKTLRVWPADGSGAPKVLRGHEDIVLSAMWSPDGARIVSASNDKTVRVWRADGSGTPKVLRGHEDRVSTAAFSADGARIVSASFDKTMRVWPADGAGQPKVLRGPEARFCGAAFSPDGARIVSASDDKIVRVWPADGAGEPQVLRGHQDIVYSATFSSDGEHIVSASQDGTARLWNIARSVQALVLRGHTDQVYAAAFSPDGARIASASLDKTVRVWRADGQGEPLVLRGHESNVESVAWSPDGARIVSASWDKTVRVWRADGQGTPKVFRGHQDIVTAAAFSPDGARIVSASWDKTVRVWRADGQGEPLVLRGHEAVVKGAAFSPDGARIVSASWDKTVRVWRADGQGEPLILRGHEAAVLGAAFSADGARIVSASVDKTVRVWPADGSGEPKVLRGHAEAAGITLDRPFSPDGTRVVSASNDGTARVWNLDGTGEPLVLQSSKEAVNAASFSPDGQQIVTASDDHTIVVWRDLTPVAGADDPRLWRVSRYCMPVGVRIRLLGFSEEQSRQDLERCEQHFRAVDP